MLEDFEIINNLTDEMKLLVEVTRTTAKSLPEMSLAFIFSGYPTDKIWESIDKTDDL